MSWYGWVILVVTVAIVAFFSLGGWRLVKGVWDGWGDGPSAEAEALENENSH